MSAIVVSFLDIYGVKQLGQDANLKLSSKNVVSNHLIVKLCLWTYVSPAFLFVIV